MGDVTVEAVLVVTRGTTTVRFPIIEGSVSGKALEDSVDDWILDVSVPAVVDGQDYSPHYAGAFLSGAGETAHIEWTTTTGTDIATYRSVEFQIEACDINQGRLALSGHGLLSRVKAHERRAAVQYSRFTRATDAAKQILAEDGIEAVVSPDTPRVLVPQGWASGTDRWGTLLELVQGMPAVLRQVGSTVEVRPALKPPVPHTRVLADGEGGSVIEAPESFARAERPNHVIVRGTPTEGPDFAVEIFEQVGDFRPEVYGWVTAQTVDSATVTNPIQATAVARARLYEIARQAMVLKVRAVADLSLTLDEPVLVTFGSRQWLGRVCGVEWPADGVGEMSIEVGV